MRIAKILTAFVAAIAALASGACEVSAEINSPTIEVSGSATIEIIPDLITFEVGLEEYFIHNASGDSVAVTLPEIEKQLMDAIARSGIDRATVQVADIGNYRDSRSSETFRMAKRISATATSVAQIDRLAASLPRRGVTSFQITRLDNTDIESYNRRGLEAALDAAAEKAASIAKKENMGQLAPWRIVENGADYGGSPLLSNAVYYNGAPSADSFKRIVRRYSVKVLYISMPAGNEN